MELELIIMNIINYSGEARSLSMESIAFAKEGNFEKANQAIEEATVRLSLAHKSQTKLIQEEARGETKQISLLLIHAQDHLMNAITVKDMAYEFIELYSLFNKFKGDL